MTIAKSQRALVIPNVIRNPQTNEVLKLKSKAGRRGWVNSGPENPSPVAGRRSPGAELPRNCGTVQTKRF